MISIEEIENDEGVLIGTITDDGSTSEQPTESAKEQSANSSNNEVNSDTSDVSGIENESKEEQQIQSLVDKKGVKSFSKNQQEKLGHSFAKLKQKHKQELETLKGEIEQLKKQLETKVVKTDFEDEDAYLDAKLNERLAKRELDQKQKELDSSSDNLNIQLYTERAKTLYPTSVEQQAYTRAYKKGIEEGTINLVMGDSLIREFIHESEYGPKLIEHFCQKPEVAERLSTMGVARKSVELVALETRLANYLNKLKTDTQVQSKEKMKVKAPAVGSVANKGANKTNEDRFQTDEDLWEFMRSC